MPRPITKYFLTVPHFSDKHSVEIILKHELLAKTYIISTEQHFSSDVLEGNAEHGSQHVHAYFELQSVTEDESSLSTIRERLCSGFQAVAGEEAPSGFDIQACKHPDKCIKYITKVGYHLF